MLEKRKLIVPTDAQEIEYPEVDCVAYFYIQNERPCMMFFSGKKKNPEVHMYYKDEYFRQNHLNQLVNEKLTIKYDKEKRKQQKKIQEEKAFKDIKPGDIFHQGGGYDQTNCSFFQLISLKGKTGTFRAIRMETVPGSEGFMSCKEKPKVDDFCGQEFKSRIVGDRIKPEYDRAYKCSADDEFYHSWYA